MTQSSRRQASPPPSLRLLSIWWIAPIGILLCLANVFVIMNHVVTHTLLESKQADVMIVSPDTIVRRISSSHNGNTKEIPPIIHAGKMMKEDAINTTLLEANGQDDVDEGYEDDAAGDNDAAGDDDNDDDAAGDDDNDDGWWLADDAERLKHDLDEPGDREPILQILRDAGFHDVDNETLATLPTWSEVTRLYGLRPRIHGLETCGTFRNHSDPPEHFIGTAGNFNTGTNLLSELLIHNCVMTQRMKKYGSENKGVRWQVPWGKHSPPLDDEFRKRHKTKPGDRNIDADNVMPIVTIRDPYVWMQSMCRHNYGAHWPSDTGHCPNLVPDQRDIQAEPWLKYKKSVPIDVQYSEFNREHDSLVHFWNEWYSEYLRAPFPRVIIRFEDLVFHAKEVTTKVCECAGGTVLPKFTYITDSAKKGTPGAHGSRQERTSFIDAIIKYGKHTNRLKGFTSADVEFARHNLNLELMNLLGYQFDDPIAAVE